MKYISFFYLIRIKNKQSLNHNIFQFKFFKNHCVKFWGAYSSLISGCWVALQLYSMTWSSVIHLTVAASLSISLAFCLRINANLVFFPLFPTVSLFNNTANQRWNSSGKITTKFLLRKRTNYHCRLSLNYHCGNFTLPLWYH